MDIPHKAPEDLSRRQFLETSTSAGLGLFLAESPLLAQRTERNLKKRYVNVGVGSRSIMYQEAINRTYADTNEMVGYCDVNEGRLRLAQGWGQRDTGRGLGRSFHGHGDERGGPLGCHGRGGSGPAADGLQPRLE